MRVILLGPPGAGKGTQAQLLSTRLGVVAISTGDIFRANVGAGTELGKVAKKYLDTGELVPDEVTMAMVRERLAADDVVAGYLLDGFPRTTMQAQGLDEHLASVGQPLDGVLEIQVPTEELVARLSGRGRRDDSPETVRRRLEVYTEQTAPLVDYYHAQGLLHAIPGVGAVEEVTERAIGALSAARSS